MVPLLVFFLVAARERAVRVAPPDIAPQDIFSSAEPAFVTTRHISLDLTVDFETRTLRGSARLDIVNLSGTNRLVLDTDRLTIDRITLDAGEPTLYSTGDETRLGAPLTIAIKPSTRSVTIEYSTMEDAAGLEWNTAAQSFGRQLPYLYSQNESIYARSWIPSQDTPSVRSTYDATIRVPPGFLALMSAENPTATNESGVYTFRMPQSVPAYLIALAVGRLEFRPLSSRTGVYAEPELVDDAARELQYVPAMLDAAEAIAGPYRFERYDILLMPPTYILGGMEHPRLNFLNPFSIVTQNRDQQPVPASLVAHELAHSWAGDLLTLATWSDAWFNEGVTTYLENRIMEKVAGERYAEYQAFISGRGYADYARQPAARPRTILHRPLSLEVHPDAVFDSTSYVKGSLFLSTLERELGRPTLDAVIKELFTRYAFQWVDDRRFVAVLRDIATKGDGVLEARIGLDEWLYQPGLPANASYPQRADLYEEVGGQAARFHGGVAAGQLATSGWTRVEFGLFLDLVAQPASQRMPELDAQFGFSAMTAPPTAWLRLVARTNYAAGRPALERVLMRGGPNGTILQLYAELVTTSSGRSLAAEIFSRAGSRYNDHIRQQVERLLSARSAAAAA